MKIVVTGSSGHLGEALIRRLRSSAHEVVGVDVLDSPFTDVLASISDGLAMRRVLSGACAVLHTATLHKPHVGSHTRQDFIDTNVSGTLVLLEEAAVAGTTRFVYTSTTSAFGRALTPAGNAPATWVTEDVRSVPRNIYGVTKAAAEDVCELVAADLGLACTVLRTSRFFPEGDDNDAVRADYDDANAKVNELLYRRVDIADVVSAHIAALNATPPGGFAKYVISATTPFQPKELAELRSDAAAVVRRLFPAYEEIYGALGWRIICCIQFRSRAITAPRMRHPAAHAANADRAFGGMRRHHPWWPGRGGEVGEA